MSYPKFTDAKVTLINWLGNVSNIFWVYGFCTAVVDSVFGIISAIKVDLLARENKIMLSLADGDVTEVFHELRNRKMEYLRCQILQQNIRVIKF